MNTLSSISQSNNKKFKTFFPLTFFTLLIFCLYFPLQAAWSPVPPADQTLYSSPNNQSFHDFALNSAGDKAISVWVEKLGTTIGVIKASLFDATTRTWSVPSDLTSGTTNVTTPKIAMNAAGDLAIAIWLEDGAVNSKQFNGTWSATTNLAASGAQGISLAMNPTNNKALVAWGTATDAQTIIYDGTASWSIPMSHAAGTGTYVRDTVVTMSGDGTRSAIAFTQRIKDGITAHAVICFDTTGPGSWDTVMQLSPPKTPSYTPSISMNANGLKAVATWTCFDTTTERHTLQTRFYDSGWLPVTTLTNNLVDSFASQVIMSSDGWKAILIWVEGPIPCTIKSSSWSGANWSTPVILSATSQAMQPYITAVADLSKAFAVWPEGTTGQRTVRVSNYDGITGWQSPPSTLTLSSPLHDAYELKILTNTTGDSQMIMWRYTATPNIIQWSRTP